VVPGPTVVVVAARSGVVVVVAGSVVVVCSRVVVVGATVVVVGSTVLTGAGCGSVVVGASDGGAVELGSLGSGAVGGAAGAGVAVVGLGVGGETGATPDGGSGGVVLEVDDSSGAVPDGVAGGTRPAVDAAAVLSVGRARTTVVAGGDHRGQHREGQPERDQHEPDGQAVLGEMAGRSSSHGLLPDRGSLAWPPDPTDCPIQKGNRGGSSWSRAGTRRRDGAG